MILNLITIFALPVLAACAKHHHKTSGKLRQHNNDIVVDRQHFQQTFGDKLDHFKHSPLANLQRRGSPWPWYEDSKVNYKTERRLHREVQREQEDHQKEYKKQFEENNRLHQEMQRVHTETERETALMKQQDNSTEKEEKNTRSKDEVLLPEKESKKFLKSHHKHKHY